MNTYQCALTIAGSDSSGGAGIQADLKTFYSLGCFGLSAITAVTAQNSLGIQEILPLPAPTISSQINSILTDIHVSAIKLGMLTNKASVDAVCASIEKYTQIPLVIDPVIKAKDGTMLLDEEGLKALILRLIPQAFIITPNIYEAENIASMSINSKNDMEKAAKKILQLGCNAVLVKGGHLNSTNCSDCLLIKDNKNSPMWFNAERYETKNLHGTGCTLSSAIAAFTALGENLETSVYKAKEYVYSAIKNGGRYSFGSGWGPLKPAIKLDS
jgi:hydroxymethylpyrimidine/phosphomethylpyrimidine kinase